MCKIAVYTCIVNDYDYLFPLRIPSEGIDFYCFTDKPCGKIRGWKTLPLAHPSSVVRPDLINRYHKLFPHIVLPNIDYSIYIDGNIEVIGDMRYLVEVVKINHAALGCLEHPQRNTILEEIQACIILGKFRFDDEQRVDNQLDFYRQSGMPLDSRLLANFYLVRNHNDDGLSEAMNLWWQNILDFTCRDQLSLPFVVWKTRLRFTPIHVNPFVPNPYLVRNSHRSESQPFIKKILPYLRKNFKFNV